MSEGRRRYIDAVIFILGKLKHQLRSTSMDFKKYLPITWPVLYVGLKNNWFTSQEVVTGINENLKQLNCDEETLIKVNINEDNVTVLLEILRNYAEGGESDAIQIGKLARLISIDQSELSIKEKLEEIELQWSRFGYPDTWLSFINYITNKEVHSEQDLYQNFSTFLNREKERLNLKIKYT
jgi:hypothetical protein